MQELWRVVSPIVACFAHTTTAAASNSSSSSSNSKWALINNMLSFAHRRQLLSFARKLCVTNSDMISLQHDVDLKEYLNAKKLKAATNDGRVFNIRKDGDVAEVRLVCEVIAILTL